MARRSRSRKSGNSTTRRSSSKTKAEGSTAISTSAKPMKLKPKPKDPLWYRTWLGIKSGIQLFQSFYSLSFIYESSISVPGYYDPFVWEKEIFYAFFIGQACFEMVDFASELTSFYLQRDAHGTMPLDSIAHHILTSLYYLQAVYFLEDPSHQYLGMVMACLCCQVMGPLYNAYRYGFRGKNTLVVMILVQFMFRWPLGALSWFRAFIHFADVPMVHFMMASILVWLDYRWSKWMIKRLLHVRERDHARKAKAIELQWLENIKYADFEGTLE